MNYFIFILAVLLLQEIPFKPKEAFEVKLDYEFRQRPLADRNTVRLGRSPRDYDRRSSGSVLPYLILYVKILELQEDKMRVQVTTNLDERTMYKRIDVNDVLELDVGFTDDMIDRVTAHEYTLTFLDSDKEPVDKIVVSVEEDGSFVVNGEKRGQF